MVARAVRLDHTAATASAIRLRANACGQSRTHANCMGQSAVPIFGMIAAALTDVIRIYTRARISSDGTFLD